ncbi:MAG TPA: site-specific integrase [Pirellulales bacterium]
MAYVGGQKTKLAEGKSNRRAAQSRLDELRDLAEANPDPDSGEHTVASIIERYMGIVFPTLGVETRKARFGYLQDFAEAHGDRRVADCRKDHLQEWLLKHKSWKSDWTKRSALRAVQGVFCWAADADLIPKNPFRKIRQAAGSPRRDMTFDEFRAILRTTAGYYKKRPTPGARFRQILFFLWLTGCRPAEAAKLRWDEVDLDGGVIVLRHHKTIKTQRKPKPRIVPLVPVVVSLLRHIKRTSRGDRVFSTHRGTPWNRYNLGLRVRRARVKGGVSDDVKLYGVRHAFGTRGIVNGLDIKTLSHLMGHETTQMTEHYLHLAGRRDYLAAAMQTVSGRRPGA